MQEVENFIKGKLKQLANKYQDTTFSYGFDVSYNQHIIMVVPESIYKKDEFAKSQIDFELDFLKIFPNEDIVFLTESDDYILADFRFSIKTPKHLFDANSDCFQIPALLTISSIPFKLNSKIETNIIGDGLIKTKVAYQEQKVWSSVKFDKDILSAYNSLLLPEKLSFNIESSIIKEWLADLASFESSINFSAPGEDNSYAMAA